MPGPLYGEAAIEAYRGTGSGLGAYLDLAEREGAEVVLPIAAGAPPSRPVEDAAFEHIAGIICDAVAKGGFDGIMLDLHGAMVTESFEDGEGELLRRIRAIDPDTPIAVSLDMHANLYDAIDRQRDDRHRLPHLPAYRHLRHRQARRRNPAAGDARRDAGRSWPGATSRCCRMSCGRARTTTRTRNCRRAAAAMEPMRARSPPACSPASRMPTSPMPGCRRSSSPTATATLAERLRDELLDRAWADREDFVYKLEPLEESLARAKSLEPPKPGEGPIVLLDHYDNCASGGTMDTTAVLAAILREGLENVAAFAIYDPEAVQQAIAAGIGAR